ncbi:YqaA family protein [Volucribacter amazonae]|uniref:Membrane protein YqaA with SNARE-associated domain n=1 Tax=Volucribacter amazonae TaxID=256731 RepID=A0A9X4SL45_9PAST|nr:DedA family protein [Volucribacter amazonae]MDG6895769.1 hypothetical protein [Volucribacter amazonae]
MLDWFFSSQFWLELLLKYGLWVMFLSALLSATLLPGNSEIIFVTLAINHFSVATNTMAIGQLLLVATLGNSLGSLSTYWLGRLLPQPYFATKQTKSVWAIQQVQRFGVWALLFSWLPVVGDVLCAVAGWLRLNALWTGCCIVLAKALRYVFLLLMLL